jgi:hypothetical protein
MRFLKTLMVLCVVFLPGAVYAQSSDTATAGTTISHALNTVLSAGYDMQSIIYGEWIGGYGGFLVALRYAIGMTDERRVAALFLSLFLFCTGYVVINAAITAWMLVA